MGGRGWAEFRSCFSAKVGPSRENPGTHCSKYPEIGYNKVMAQMTESSPGADLLPIGDAAARFQYRDQRYFRRYAARQKYGLTVLRVGSRYFVRRAEVDAWWAKFEATGSQEPRNPGSQA